MTAIAVYVLLFGFCILFNLFFNSLLDVAGFVALILHQNRKFIRVSTPVNTMIQNEQRKKPYVLDKPSSRFQPGKMTGSDFCAFKNFSDSTEALCCVFKGDMMLHANPPFLTYFNLNDPELAEGYSTIPGQVAALLCSDELQYNQHPTISLRKDVSGSVAPEQEYLLMRRWRLPYSDNLQPRLSERVWHIDLQNE